MDDIRSLLVIAKNNNLDTPQLMEIISELHSVSFSAGYDTSFFIDIIDLLNMQDSNIDELCLVEDIINENEDISDTLTEPPIAV